MPTLKRALRHSGFDIKYYDDGLVELVPRQVSSYLWDWLPPLRDRTGFVAAPDDRVDFIFRGERVARSRWWLLGSAAAPKPDKEPQEPESLFNYRHRVGAERKSFRRYVVREPSANGYFHDKFIINVAADGVIKIRSAFGKELSKEDAIWPTPEEQTAIKAEVAPLAGKGGWPNSINANDAMVADLRRQLRMKAGREPELFVSRSESGDEVLFVQERIRDKNDNKSDLPWSFWSDGQWRCMEPDSEAGLPLFGLEQLKDAVRVFVHEGPKTAYHVQCMIGARPEVEAERVVKKYPHLADCPWKPDLSVPGTVHVGWPGGGPNSHRVDWSPLAKLPPYVQLIVVCDHDPVGEEAVTSISRRLKRSMAALRFDDKFDPGFDLADRWPSEAAWWRGARYIGPKLHQMLEPATWATEVKPNPKGKGAPIIELRREFTQEWLASEEPHGFVHRDYCDRFYKPEVFDAVVRPFSDAEGTARLVEKSFQAKVKGLAYRPQKKKVLRRAEVVTTDEGRMVNTYRPSAIEPKEGDPKPWLDFLEYLVVDAGDRHELMRWCATFIDRPEVKMLYGLLLISRAQGIGKSTLGEAILAPLAGFWNTSIPTEQELVGSNYNSWAAHKRLAICHEIYSGQSRKAYDRLKSVITERKIDVLRKYMEEYSLDNYLHVLACSNSLQALYLDPQDRRWFVPLLTEKKKDKSYWREFNEWLSAGGLAIIAWWASEFLGNKKNEPVAPGEDAPTSSRKAEIIDASRSDGKRMAYDLGRLAVALGKEKGDDTGKVILSLDDVRRFVAEQRKLDLSDHRLEKRTTLAEQLTDAGMIVPERRPDDKDAVRRFQIKTGENKEPVVANFLIRAEERWPELVRFYKKPHDLLRL